MRNFALRSSAGTIRSRGDFKFEIANFQVSLVLSHDGKELSYLVHSSSSFEELFVRRNAVILFMQRFKSV